MGGIYQPALDGPTHQFKSLAIEKPYESPATYGELFTLPQSTDYADYELNGLAIAASTADHASFDAGSGPVQKRRQISETLDLTGTILVTASDAGVAWHALKMLETRGRDTRFMCHLANSTLTPEVGSPLVAGWLSVKPFNTSGTVGDAWSTDFTHYINGLLECLETPLTPPGDVAVDALTPPTANTISIQWTSDSAKLATKDTVYEVRGYVIYYKKSADAVWIRANVTEELSANGNLQTYAVAGLDASTSYDLAVAPVWFFGKEFDMSTPVTIVTTA